jgi:N-acetylneuraminic acid mutarotase
MLLVITFVILTQSCEDTSDSDTIGNWVLTSPFPGAPRSGAIYFTIDDRVYAGLGFNPNSDDSEYVVDGYFRDCYVFDASLGYWSQIASFPGELRERAVSFSVNGYGFIGLGYNRELDDTEMRDFWRYDPEADEWTQNENDFLGSARFSAVGFAIGDYGYVGTGFDNAGNYNGDFYQYNPENDEWTKLQGFPGKKRRGAFAFVIDGKAYIGGGTSNESFNTDFFEFDPDGNSWTNLEIEDDSDNDYDDFISAVQRYEAATFVLNGKAYVATGSSSSSILNTVIEFDPSNNSWDDVTSFEGSLRSLAIAYVVGGKAYLGTGQYSTNRYDDIWEFRPDEKYDDSD